MDLWNLTLYQPSDFQKYLKGKYLYGKSEPRIVLVGRSNVGKSSLVNHLLGRRSAQVSKTPGKTTAIHCYEWKEAKKIIVDLPGYGFAKRSHDDKKRWTELIEKYFQSDSEIECVVHLVDAKVGLTEKDQELLEFLSFYSFPIKLVLTKMDKIKKKTDLQKKIKEFSSLYRGAHWVSNLNKTGIRELIEELSK